MNTVNLTLETLEIDDNENEISNASFDLSFNYDEVFKTTFILPISATAYTSIPIETIENPFLAILSSTDDINYKLNTVEYTASSRTVINTPISSLSVYNPNAYSTTVQVIVYGVSNV
jgi:hypothetical protein